MIIFMDFFINSLPQVISHEQGYHIWQYEIPKLGQFQALWWPNQASQEVAQWSSR